MTEIKYLSKNDKGFSIDDITADRVKKTINQMVEYNFEVNGKKMKTFMVSYESDLYYTESNGFEPGWSMDCDTISELRDFLKEQLLKNGFKEKDKVEIKVLDTKKLDLSFNEYKNQKEKSIKQNSNKGVEVIGTPIKALSNFDISYQKLSKIFTTGKKILEFLQKK